MVPSNDEELVSHKLRMNNKDLFIDLKQNKNGMYLKISERSRGRRSSIVIPASGLAALSEALAAIASSGHLSDAAPAAASIAAATGEKTKQAKTNNPTRRRDQQGNAPAAASSEVDAAWVGLTSPPDSDNSEVYVLNLAFSTTDETLAALVCSVGHVPVAAAVERSKKGRSAGRALLQMESPAAAAQVIAALQGALLEGRNIELKFNQRRADRPRRQQLEVVGVAVAPASSSAAATSAVAATAAPPKADKVLDPKRVFVSNLSWGTDEQALTAYFACAGHVTHVVVQRNKDGTRSYGKSIITFDNDTSCVWAVDNLNHKLLDERAIVVRPYYA